MQFLVFHLGKDRYGLPTGQVVRVLPLMELKQVPGVPGYVAGMMNFHGKPIPVIDLCARASGQPCAAHFDTRILLVDYRTGGASHLLGLVAERVAGIEHIDEPAFVEAGIARDTAPYLGKVTSRNGLILQLIDIDRLLGPDARAILFQRGGEAVT